MNKYSAVQWSPGAKTVNEGPLALTVGQSVQVQFPHLKIFTLTTGVWQKLATRHQAEMWPLQMVTWSLQQDGAHSHTVRNTETCSVRTFCSLSQTFCLDLNMVNLPSGVLFSRQPAKSYHHQSFSSVDEIKRERFCQSMAETANARRSRSSTKVSVKGAVVAWSA